MTKHFLQVGVLSIGLCTTAMASAAPNERGYLGQCFQQAASFHQLNPDILSAIAQHESGLSPRIVSHNKNGTYDIGIMQINSRWLSNLARFGIQQQHLMDPCTNIFVGAWILSQEVQRFGNTWTAVGAYHSKSAALNLKYAWAIYRKVQQQQDQVNMFKTVRSNTNPFVDSSLATRP